MKTKETDNCYEAKVAAYIRKIMDKYAKRKYIFEPLTNVLGDYSKDIFTRSVKEVLFEKKIVYVYTKDLCKGFISSVADEYIPKKVWKLRNLDCPKNMDYALYAAKKVITYQNNLRDLIWLKNGWNTNTETTRERLKFSFMPGMVPENPIAFVDMHWKKLAYFIPNKEKRMELMIAIFKALDDRYQDGLRVGARSYKEKMQRDHTVRMADIYNNIELSLSDLKKLIDE